MIWSHVYCIKTNKNEYPADKDLYILFDIYVFANDDTVITA